MMPLLGKKNHVGKKDNRLIIWVIIIALIAAFMFWAFYKEYKEENEFQKHIQKEENHPF